MPSGQFVKILSGCVFVEIIFSIYGCFAKEMIHGSPHITISNANLLTMKLI